MATIKSFTSLEQSRKLAKILPLESADQTWARIAIAGANLDVPEELQYRHNGDMPFQYYSGIGIPCWSLAALLGVLPEKYTELIKEGDMYRIIIKDSYMTSLFDNPVDVCVAMIETLNELKTL